VGPGRAGRALPAGPGRVGGPDRPGWPAPGRAGGVPRLRGRDAADLRREHRRPWPARRAAARRLAGLRAGRRPRPRLPGLLPPHRRLPAGPDRI